MRGSVSEGHWSVDQIRSGHTTTSWELDLFLYSSARLLAEAKWHEGLSIQGLDLVPAYFRVPYRYKYKYTQISSESLALYISLSYLLTN